MSRKTLLFIVLLLGLFDGISAKDWFRIEGNRAVVEYQEGLEMIADSLLEIAEYALPRIAKMTGYNDSLFFEEKARIILTDAPDISNGFALENTVVIFALSSDYLPSWTGNQKWYEQVLTHELVHLVCFRKLHRKSNIFGTLPYLTIPRWFWEGLAQYLSETWNTYRGDIYIKNAVLQGSLSYNSLGNLQDWRLLYAAAHAYVRFLAEQYGDSSIIKLLSYNQNGWFYSFESAFSDAFGATPGEVFDDFIRHMVLHYGDKWSDYPVAQIGKSIPNSGSATFQVMPLSTNDSTYIVSAQLSENHNYATAFLGKISGKKFETQQTLFDQFNTKIVMSDDENLLAFGNQVFDEEENLPTLRFDWYIFNRETGSTQKIAKNLRCRYGVFTSDNQLLLLEILPDRSIIYQYDPETFSRKTVFETAIPLGTLAMLPDGDILATAQRENCNRDLFILHKNEIRWLTDDATDDRWPLVIDDSLFIFSRYENGNPALAVYNLNRGEFKIVLNDQFEYWPHNYNEQKSEIIAARWRDKRNTRFVTLPFDSLQENKIVYTTGQENPRYNQWTQKLPTHPLIHIPDTSVTYTLPQKIGFSQFPMFHAFSIVLPTYDNNYGFGLYGMTAWAEYLNRQAFFAGGVYFPNDAEHSLFTLGHIFKAANITWASLFYHGPIIYSYSGADYIKTSRTAATIDASKNLYFLRNSRYTIRPSISFSWDSYKLLESHPFIPRVTDYAMIRAGAYFEYHLPTRLYPFLPARQAGFSAYLHQSMDKKYDFRVLDLGMVLGNKLFNENLGIKTSGVFLDQTGKLPALQTVGIDRFYNYDLMRDQGFTRTIRGLREDIGGTRMWWSSTELVFYLSRNTGMQLLFIPLDNLAVSGFFDFARIESTKDYEVDGYGWELTFGGTEFRFGGGYGISKNSRGEINREYFLRLSLAPFSGSVALHEKGCLPAD